MTVRLCATTPTVCVSARVVCVRAQLCGEGPNDSTCCEDYCCTANQAFAQGSACCSDSYSCCVDVCCENAVSNCAVSNGGNLGTCCAASATVCGSAPDQWCCEENCVLCTENNNPAACAVPAAPGVFGNQCANYCGRNGWWVQDDDGSMGCQCLAGFTGPDCMQPVPFPWMYTYIPSSAVSGMPTCATFGVNATDCCLQLYVQANSSCFATNTDVREYITGEFPFAPPSFTTNGSCAPQYTKLAQETVYCSVADAVAAILVFL